MSPTALLMINLGGWVFASLVVSASLLWGFRGSEPVYSAEVLDWRRELRAGERTTVTARVRVRVPELRGGLAHVDLLAHVDDPAAPLRWCLHGLHLGGPDDGPVSADEAVSVHLGAALTAATHAAHRAHRRMVGRLAS